MKSSIFPTPQDAETAFYEAFENADLDAMMSVWAEDEEIICIHPTGPRLNGTAQIRESWRQIFETGIKLQIRVSNVQIVRDIQLSLHSVCEQVTVIGESAPRRPVIATNIYLLTAGGWRMLMHHASALPEGPVNLEIPSVLH